MFPQAFTTFRGWLVWHIHLIKGLHCMKKQTTSLRWAGAIALTVVVCVSAAHSASGATGAKSPVGEKRADMVTIDAMAADGKLELPPVVFLHDNHTKALAGKDCSACHKPIEGKPGQYSFFFKESDAAKGKDLKALYHANCIGCHTALLAEGKKSGPQEAECRTCHNPRPAALDDRRDIGLDKVMHNAHVQSKQIVAEGQDKNCASCHHTYDAVTDKLVWGRNKEDSCRACHMPSAEKSALEAWLKPDQALADENGLLLKRPTLGRAAHQSCVNCHLMNKDAAGELKTGPADCAGCHGATALGLLAEKSAAVDPLTVPRLERGQDDAVLMTAAPESAKKLAGSMRPVSFNHKYHESVMMDCRTCHHKKIASCSSCHSLEGKGEGNNVQQYQAMHKVDAARSCVGCHLAETQKPSCAGCHTVMPTRLSQTSCQACHSTPVGLGNEQAENTSLLNLPKEVKTELARATVAGREGKKLATPEQKDIPEKVSIGVLANEYEPSEMPHQKIYNTLVEKQKNNRIAAIFHSEETTLCQGCHLYSPPSKTPPGCVSCHPVAVTMTKDGQLPLRAAYHQQCMSCHERMNQKPGTTECVDCHKVRAN